MSEGESARPELIRRLHSLPAWMAHRDFTDREWAEFIAAARMVQSTDPEVVAAALDEFSQAARREEYRGTESESKPFILMRVVFEIPGAAPAERRFSYKGWANWPTPDSRHEVNLGWPVAWQDGRPRLLALYEGSGGRPYAAAAEYRFLLKSFPYRRL